MFDLRHCRAERTANHDYLLRWRSSRPGQRIAIYISERADHFYSGVQFGAPTAFSTGQQALIANPDRSVRHYFYLQSEQGEGAILAERQLSLQGTHNFRDLGGYQTEDGRSLKWGRLYRSSKLSALTDGDINYVNSLGVNLVCDLRQIIEQELEPSWLGHEHSTTIASLPITPGSTSNFIENLHQGVIAVDDAAGLMQEINRDFVINQMPQYAEMFRLLLAADQQLLIHCASGKDRTGFGAALILHVLGVPEDRIIDDYLLTNNYLPVEQEVQRLSREFSDHTGAPISEEVLRPLLEVRPEYLLACLDEIRKRYESSEHFYESALELDARRLAILKERYLH